LDISFSCWFRVLIAEVDGVGDKVTDTTTVDVQILLAASLNMSLRSARIICEALFW